MEKTAEQTQEQENGAPLIENPPEIEGEGLEEWAQPHFRQWYEDKATDLAEQYEYTTGRELTEDTREVFEEWLMAAFRETQLYRDLVKEQQLKEMKETLPDMEVTISSSTLKEILAIPGELVDELAIHVDSDGWHFQVVDPAHVAMAVVDIPAEIFDEYEATKGEIYTDITKLKRLANLAGITGIDLEIEEGALKARVGDITRRITLFFDDPGTEPKIPELDLDCTATIGDTDEVQRVLKLAAEDTDHILIEVDGHKAVFKGANADEGDSVRLPIYDNGNNDIDGEATVMFSLDYFKSLFKRAKNATSIVPSGQWEKRGVITMEMGTDYPCRMIFGGGNARYLLAPRIETE